MTDEQVSLQYDVHTTASRKLREVYRRNVTTLPVGGHIRLAKRTSNLFRFGKSRNSATGLDVSHFNHVLRVDPGTRTADVQGMTTYEQLVDATLPYGLMPLVVPQLKTITLGGAVTGLGIESSSFRNGLPHESVRELEILTGDGQIVVASPSQNPELFYAFPNSYGTLGYALRLQIDLEPVKPYVELHHVRFRDAEECATAIADMCRTRRFGEIEIDFCDGVVFAENELYITVGRFVEHASAVSDYTNMEIYYQSIRQRDTDYLSIRDYLWRWDTDWFWCSRAFGLGNRWVRRLWPKRWLRSDVYHHLVAFDRRYQLSTRWDNLRGRPASETVIQDIEVPVARLPQFLAAFHREIGITPAWLCPVRANQRWPLYPLDPHELYVNVGFWSTVPLRNGQAPDHHNRLLEKLVADCGGHKSLYSSVHYSKEEFWQRYNGQAYQRVKQQYDPNGYLLDLYEKCVG